MELVDIPVVARCGAETGLPLLRGGLPLWFAQIPLARPLRAGVLEAKTRTGAALGEVAKRCIGREVAVQTGLLIDVFDRKYCGCRR